MKRSYKYNIDDILASDPASILKHKNETLEALLGVFLPEDPKDFIEKAISGDAFAGVEGEELESLMQKRLEGKYKDDIEGFKADCLELKRKQKPQTAKTGLYSKRSFKYGF